VIAKTRLRNKRVIFRLKTIPTIYSGTVQRLEDDGVWIDAPDFFSELQKDAAWAVLAREIQEPLLFVPMSSLLYLMTAKDPTPQTA